MAYGYDYEDSKLILTDKVAVLEVEIDAVIRNLVKRGKANLEELCVILGVVEREMTMPTQEYLRMKINVIKERLAA